MKSKLSLSGIHKLPVSRVPMNRWEVQERLDLFRVCSRTPNLSYTNLRETDLAHAKLKGVSLLGSDLSRALMYGADLRDADLRWADFSGAHMVGAKFENAIIDHTTKGLALACPEEGSFVGFAKKSNCLLKLFIPSEAQRSSATTRKCRASMVKTLEITDLFTGLSLPILRHENVYVDDPTFYRVGELTIPSEWEKDRWEECAPGIHFFLNKNDALTWEG